MTDRIRSRPPSAAGEILRAVLSGLAPAGAAGGSPRPEPAPQAARASGRYDFDLAEFPLFHFHKRGPVRAGREPLVYADTITGQDGTPVARTWRAYPGPFGFGGPTAHALLFDLLQLYAEQGACGSQIQFGTLRSLLLRRGERHPSKRDYDRLRRDFDVLRGYDLHCSNAFWDARRRAYVDMNWRLFGAIFYFRGGSGPGDDELPFGFVEVSPTFRAAARGRGLFPLGFGPELFHRLKPLEQRLAVYLAKKFGSQVVHRRFVDDLARALPVGAARPADVRVAVRKAAEGLLAHHLPTLRAFRLDPGRDGRWVASFARAAVPRQLAGGPGQVVSPEVRCHVDRITDALGSDADRVWWGQCVRRLGPGAVDRALGLLKEARGRALVRNPGGLLTKIFKDLAVEAGVALR